MNSTLRNQIMVKLNDKFGDKIKTIIDDILKNQSDFGELFESNQHFYQLRFYISMNTTDTYRISLKDDPSNFAKRMENLNNEMNIYFKELISDFEVYTKRDIRYFMRIGQDLGFHDIKIFNRNKELELKEDEEMESNSTYTVKCSYCGDGGCVYCEPYRFL